MSTLDILTLSSDDEDSDIEIMSESIVSRPKVGTELTPVEKARLLKQLDLPEDTQVRIGVLSGSLCERYLEGGGVTAHCRVLKEGKLVQQKSVRGQNVFGPRIKPVADVRAAAATFDILTISDESYQDEKKPTPVRRTVISTQNEKETLKKMRKREELGSLRNKMAKLEEEIEETVVIASDRLERENDDLVKATTMKNQAIRDFLNATILEKEALLECPVCFQTATPPIYKCSKEHLICCKCFPRMKNNKCPTCRTEFSKNGSDNVFRFAEENWKELQKMKDKIEEI